MANPNEVISKILDINLADQDANYYSLLQIPVFTSDQALIKDSLQKAVTKLRSAAASEAPAAIDTVKKLLGQCHAVLTNTDKKAVYDQQLKQRLTGSAAVQSAAPKKTPPTQQTPASVAADVQTPKVAPSKTSRVQPASAPSAAQATSAPPPAAAPVPLASAPIIPEVIDPLADLLPAGDPKTDFSMRDYLNSSPPLPATESIESRLQEIEALKSSMHAVAKKPLQAALSSNSVGSATKLDSPRPGSSIQQRIRRRRAIQNSLTVGGLTLISIGLVGTAVYQYLNRAKPKANSPLAQAAPAATLASDTKAPSIEPASPTDDEPDATKTNEPLEKPAFELPSFDERLGKGTQSFFSDSPDDAASPKPAMADDAMKPAMDTKPANFDQTNWDRLVSALRISIADKDFEKFESLIDEFLAIEIAEPTLVMLRSAIDRTGQLYQLGSNAFTSSVNSLQSGSALTLEDDIISFVENNGDQLTFRIKGKNTSYAIDKLPVSLVLAILNQELDTREAVDVAARGVFLKLYSAADEYQTAGDQLLADAAKKEAKFAEIDDLSQSPYRP